MRRCSALLAAAALLLTGVTAAADASPRVVLDGRELRFDVPARISGGRVLVPMRSIFESLGATVGWDEQTRTVTATRGQTTVYLPIGAGWAYVNGRAVPLDVPAAVVDGRTLVPLRFVAEALGANVGWDGATGTVVLATPATGPALVSPSTPFPGPTPGPALAAGPAAALPWPQRLPGPQRECIEARLGLNAKWQIENRYRTATADEQTLIQGCLAEQNDPNRPPGSQGGPPAGGPLGTRPGQLSRPAWPAAELPKVSVPLTIVGEFPDGNAAAQASFALYFPYLVKYLGPPMHFQSITWNWIPDLTDPNMVGWDYKNESIRSGPVPHTMVQSPEHVPYWRLYWQYLHETGHLFYGLGDNVIQFASGQWLWEAHSLVAEALTHLELGENLNDLFTYDAIANMGPDRVNGVFSDGNKYNRTTENFAAARALQLLTEVLSADTGLDYLRRVNAGLLAHYRATGQALITGDAYARALNTVAAGRTIDGQAPGDWLFAQPVANTKGAPGSFVLIYPHRVYQSNFDGFDFNVAAFTRRPASRPEDVKETALAGLNLMATVQNSAGQTLPPSGTAITGGDGTAQLLVKGTAELAPGAYMVTASATVQGKPVTHSNFFVVLSRDDPNDTHGATDARLMVVPMSADGSALRPDLVDTLQIRGATRLNGPTGVLVLQADPGTGVELSLGGFQAVVSKPLGLRVVPLRVPDSVGQGPG